MYKQKAFSRQFFNDLSATQDNDYI